LLDCFVCVQRDYGVGIIKNRHCNKKMAMNSASLSGNLSSSSEAAAWAPAAIMSLQPRISIRPALLSLSPWYTSYSSHIIQVMYIFSWGNYLLHSLFVSGVVPVGGLVGNEPACSYPAVRIRIISSRILSVFFSACKDDLFFFASEVCQQYMKIPDPSLASLLICHGWRGLFTDQELMRTSLYLSFLAAGHPLPKAESHVWKQRKWVCHTLQGKQLFAVEKVMWAMVWPRIMLIMRSVMSGSALHLF
jgi:hypothetical protein